MRVSRVAGREGESFASPAEQRERIASACERDGLELVETIDELEVSGGTPLDRRPGLSRAVEAVEAGRADVVMVAYFDRLVRSLAVQGEVVGRVERAGGQVLALDVGQISEATASQWITSTFLGAVAEYGRRAARERAGEAQARAVGRGVAPWPQIPPGYRRRADGILEPDRLAPIVAEAFALRAGGATIKEIRAFLGSRGIERSYHGVQAMLGSRVYLGEIHFGDLRNRTAHEPIVDRETWEACRSDSRGPRAHSDRLLARLGVLRCGTCGARMVVGAQTSAGRRYGFYRCPPVGDCPRRVTISAEIVEALVRDAVKDALGDVEGRASAEANARRIQATAEDAQQRLDAAIRAFAELGDEPVAIERLRELRAARDQAAERAEHLGGPRLLTVTVEDWGRLTLAERRALIGAVVERVDVDPGRGPGRVRIRLVE